MIEYAFLILGIGLVVFNGAKLILSMIDQLASFMATREIEVAKERNDEEDKNYF